MVSAKFHIVGEDGDWFRVRAQEEVYAHGLEGDVLKAAEKILVVIVEGDEHAIRRMHADMLALCPQGIRCSDLIVSQHKIDRSQAGGKQVQEHSQEYVLQLLKEMERRITRIDQNVSRLIALYEGGSRPAAPQTTSLEDKKKDEAATDGFSAMFGEG
jgi:hypothetical protein